MPIRLPPLTRPHIIFIHLPPLTQLHVIVIKLPPLTRPRCILIIVMVMVMRDARETISRRGHRSAR